MQPHERKAGLQSHATSQLHLIFCWNNMTESPKPKAWFITNNIRNCGILLFILSFIIPPRMPVGADFAFFGGAVAFIQTPFVALNLISESHGRTPQDYFLCLVMLAAWVTNFTVFFRLPVLIVLIAMILPWVAYYCCLFGILAGFIPFYLWVLGISLIQISGILKRWHDELPEPETRRPRFGG